MTKSASLIYYIPIFAIGLTSCSDKKESDPNPTPASPTQIAPAPKAAFTQDKKYADLNDTIRFTSASINASRVEWDLGNGKKSTDINPLTSYATKGIYRVKLTIYNSDNKTDTISSVINVGERYLTGIKVNKIKMVQMPGVPWDPNDGPDLRFRLRKLVNTTSWEQTINLGDDFTTSMFGQSVTLSTPIKLTNETWRFEMHDSDTPDPDQMMFSTQINPFNSKDFYDDGLGTYWLIGVDMEIILLYELRWN